MSTTASQGNHKHSDYIKTYFNPLCVAILECDHACSPLQSCEKYKVVPSLVIPTGTMVSLLISQLVPGLVMQSQMYAPFGRSLFKCSSIKEVFRRFLSVQTFTNVLHILCVSIRSVMHRRHCLLLLVRIYIQHSSSL